MKTQYTLSVDVTVTSPNKARCEKELQGIIGKVCALPHVDTIRVTPGEIAPSLLKQIVTQGLTQGWIVGTASDVELVPGGHSRIVWLKKKKNPRGRQRQKLSACEKGYRAWISPDNKG